MCKRNFKRMNTCIYELLMLILDGGKRPKMFNHTGSQRSKRYVGELKVELLVVTDFPVYDL